MVIGALEFDPAAREVLIRGHRPALTGTELGILEILMRRSPGIADRRSIAQHVWDNEADAFGSNTIDVHLARLRSKLAGAGVRIETVRGVGYRIAPLCRYAGADGRVRIQVRAQGSRVSLTVEDSGPGIPEADRPRLFDRFHRATEHGPGAGLGLAIGDSIVRSTGGRWHVGDSPLGGALMSVSWRHSQPHCPAASRMMTSSA